MDISVAVDYANGNSYGLPDVTNLGLIQQNKTIWLVASYF
jgi:hypothetical protein